MDLTKSFPPFDLVFFAVFPSFSFSSLTFFAVSFSFRWLSKAFPVILVYLVRCCCNTWSCAFLIHNKYLWLKRNSKFESTLGNSNCYSNVQTFEISENLWMFDETPYQTSPTWKIYTFASKHVGWNFVLEQTSSNIIQHDFFFFFETINFVIAQTISTFHPTWQKRDVGWNVGQVCWGLWTVFFLWLDKGYYRVLENKIIWTDLQPYHWYKLESSESTSDSL